MVRKTIEYVNDQFAKRIKPKLILWGLDRHPNPASYFGRSDHGYRYDFADLDHDSKYVRIAAFSIIGQLTSLWIKGLVLENNYSDPTRVPMIYDSMESVYTLNNNWSVLRPLNVRFQLRKNIGDRGFDRSISRLFDDVETRLPYLKAYLYASH